MAVVDEVGAGDGFTAGFAYGLLLGWAPEACTASGDLVAARALGGNRGLGNVSTRDEFESDLEATQMSNIERVNLKRADR